MNRDLTKEMLHTLVHEITHGFEYSKTNGNTKDEFHKYIFEPSDYSALSQNARIERTKKYVKEYIGEDGIEAALYRNATIKVLSTKKFYD